MWVLSFIPMKIKAQIGLRARQMLSTGAGLPAADIDARSLFDNALCKHNVKVTKSGLVCIGDARILWNPSLPWYYVCCMFWNSSWSWTLLPSECGVLPGVDQHSHISLQRLHLPQIGIDLGLKWKRYTADLGASVELRGHGFDGGVQWTLPRAMRRVRALGGLVGLCSPPEALFLSLIHI